MLHITYNIVIFKPNDDSIILKPNDDNIILQGTFATATGTGKLVRLDLKMDGYKYMVVLEENLIKTAKEIKLHL